MIDLVYTSIENIETIKYMLSSHLTEPVRQKMEHAFSLQIMYRSCQCLSKIQKTMQL